MELFVKDLPDDKKYYCNLTLQSFATEITYSVVEA